MRTASQMSHSVCGDCLVLTRRKREQAPSWKADGSALGKCSSAVAAENESERSWVNWKPTGQAWVLARETMPWRGKHFPGCIVLLKEMSKWRQAMHIWARYLCMPFHGVSVNTSILRGCPRTQAQILNCPLGRFLLLFFIARHSGK